MTNKKTNNDPIFDGEPFISSAISNRLAVDLPHPLPPRGLAERTLNRLEQLFLEESIDLEQSNLQSATALGQNKTAVRSTTTIRTSDEPVLLGRRRADLIIAACIGFLFFGLAITFVQKMRNDSGMLQCQNNLRVLHSSLSSYASSHQGRYPVGNTAGEFADELRKSGTIPEKLVLSCPLDKNSGSTSMNSMNSISAGNIETVGYTYTLGYRMPNGKVIGFQRPSKMFSDEDGIPLVADLPCQSVSPSTGSFSPHIHGQNVLFAGGNVRYSKTSNVGINGDDIYRNEAGLIGAGLSAGDACLGRPNDRP